MRLPAAVMWPVGAAHRKVVWVPATTLRPCRQKRALDPELNGGNGPHATPVTLVRPKAAGLARISLKSEKRSIGITRRPALASPENNVVL